ncbi:hypothetical protein MMC19_004190 [Ptychographa xylographoides]|nr:hypothetical protein [Ptychographa xylographoides]
MIAVAAHPAATETGTEGRATTEKKEDTKIAYHKTGMTMTHGTGAQVVNTALEDVPRPLRPPAVAVDATIRMEAIAVVRNGSAHHHHSRPIPGTVTTAPLLPHHHPTPPEAGALAPQDGAITIATTITTTATSKRRSSPSPKPSTKPQPFQRSTGPLPSQSAAFTSIPTDNDPSSTSALSKPAAAPPPEKQVPNFAPSGALAADTNTVAGTGTILKYNEPPTARLPPASSPWRLYVFKGATTLDTLELGTRSCWLFGREGAVVDYVTEHPSCSKQHAVLQFRFVEKRDEWGERRGGVGLYVLDLESANGTRLNGERVPERRYVECKSGDVLRFGDSTREYVLLLPPKEGAKA